MARYISQPRLEGPIWLEPNEIYFLQDLVAETNTQAESLENQIKQADKDHITQLIHEKDAKIVELASLRNILSPIRRMPLEVLSEIFELSCFPFNGIFTADYNIIESISRISLVCVAWRKAALSTPKLWSKICIDYQWGHPDVEQMKEWLVRSKGFPLELYLSFFTLDWPAQFPSNLDSLMDCIVEFRGQITLISLVGMSRPFLHLFRLPCASFSLLEKLMLNLDHSRGPGDLWNLLPQRIEAFTGAPSLQHLGIIGTFDSQLLSRFMLPLEQLTSLCLHVQFDQDALRQCSNLVSLKAGSGLCFDTAFSICLPSLKFLDVASHRFTLLHGLTAPVLEGLVLRWYSWDIHDLCRAVIGFQNRSATRLSLLRLHGYTNRVAEDLLPILATFPTVQSFSVDPWERQYDIDVLIQAMIYTKSKPVLLPQLTSLDISFSDDLKADSVISLIRSRWWSDSIDSEVSDDIGVARLQKVTLFRWSSIVKRDDFNFPTLIVDLKP